jgi:diguanylate cyclase (GGDEF)-like protein/PAS domain S-box-containing protein
MHATSFDDPAPVREPARGVLGRDVDSPGSPRRRLALPLAAGALLLLLALGIGAALPGTRGLGSSLGLSPTSAAADFHRELLALAVANLVALTIACGVLAAVARRRALRSATLEQARHEENARVLRLLEDIANSSPDAIYARDDDGRFIFVNRQVCRSLRASAGELVGRSVESLFPPEQAAAMRQSDQVVMRGNRSVTDVVPLTTPDGDRDFSFTKNPLRDSRGVCVGICAVGRDITDSKRDEATRRQWAMAFESTRDGVMITDPRGRILTVNRAFTTISGYSAESLVGQTPRILRSGRHGPEFYQAMWQALQGTGHWQGEVWNRRSNGEVFPQLLSVSAVRDADDRVVNYVSVATDVSPLQRSEASLAQLAHFDPLTNLPNRRAIQRHLEDAIARCVRHGGELAVLYIDLDGFKTVNDSLGHPAGDELLLAVANRLTLRLRETDKLGRLGGDEFLVLLEGIKSSSEAAVVARDLLATLAAPIPLVCGRVAYVTGSMGISVLPEGQPTTAVEMMRDADTAMYRAKDQGRNRFCFYTADLNAIAIAKLEMEGALCQALARGELLLHYQPKIDAASGRIAGVEALLRWRREDRLVPPGQFIPIAEQSSLILDIGAWVIDKACAQVRAWLDAGAPAPRIAVNVAARQFAAGDLDIVLTKALERHDVPAACLEVELTESMLMDRPEKTAPMLQRIRRLGVSLSLDDFGTGYSNLGYLQQFPLDFLKIDQSFVRAMGGEPDGTVLVDAIISLAHRLGLKVVAEGVETAAQRDYLLLRGCDELQGYLFSRPLDITALDAWLRGREVEGRARLLADESS